MYCHIHISIHSYNAFACTKCALHYLSILRVTKYVTYKYPEAAVWDDRQTPCGEPRSIHYSHVCVCSCVYVTTSASRSRDQDWACFLDLIDDALRDAPQKWKCVDDSPFAVAVGNTRADYQPLLIPLATSSQTTSLLSRRRQLPCTLISPPPPSRPLLWLWAGRGDRH